MKLVHVLPLMACILFACSKNDGGNNAPPPPPPAPTPAPAATNVPPVPVQYVSNVPVDGSTCPPSVVDDFETAGTSCFGSYESMQSQSCQDAQNAFKYNYPNVNCVFSDDNDKTITICNSTGNPGSCPNNLL